MVHRGERGQHELVFLVFSENADIGRACQAKHAVEQVAGDADLGATALVTMGAQEIANHLLVARDHRLRLGPRVVAGRSLPGHASRLDNRLDVTVAQSGRGLDGGAEDSVGARWRDHRRLRVAGRHGPVHVGAVAGTVTDERLDRRGDLIEQGNDLRGIVDVGWGQLHGGDLPRSSVHPDVELAPGAALLGAVLLNQPFAGPAEFQPRAVDQQVQRAGGLRTNPHGQGSGPSAQGGVIRHRQVQPQQLHQRADQSFGLPEGQMEKRPQGQRRLDRHGRVARLSAAGGAWGGSPVLNGLRAMARQSR